MSTYVYTPLPQGAKPVAWWWAILQLIVMFAIALVGGLIVAVIGSIAAVSIGIINGSFDPASGAEPPAYVIGVGGLTFMLGMFLTLGLCALVKIRMEKRTLASAGMSGFFYGAKFWKGFAGGIAIAALLGVPAGLAGMAFGIEEEAALNTANLMSSGFLITVACVFLFVMVQAPAEEILMRGWMLSALSWRHGLVTAVVASSILFSLLHADRAVAGLMWAVYTLVAVGSIGVLFAGVSWFTRSVLPAAGMHTGYNFTLITAGLAYALASSDTDNVFEAVMELFDMSALPEFEFTPVTMTDILARGAIPLAIAIWLFRRRKAEAAPAAPAPAVTSADERGEIA